MLDYVANGLAYWSMEQLRYAAVETATQRGKSLDSEVQALLDNAPDADIEGFWQRVESNLRIGKVP